MIIEKGSVFLTRVMLALFILLEAVALLLGMTDPAGGDKPLTLALGVLMAAVFYVAARKWNLSPVGEEDRRKTLIVWGILSLLCLAVKLAWVLAVRVPIEGDYEVFWLYADYFAKNKVAFGNRYIALFPHIFGYSWFLSWFTPLFGTAELLAPVLNVLLTLCSGSLLSLISRRLLGLRAAVCAYLLWILCPSQTMYNTLVLSEPLYTTLALVYLFLLSWLWGKKSLCSWAWAATGAGAGVVLRWVNALRPIAVILLIALAIWIFLLKPKGESGKGWLLLLGSVLAVYMILGPFWNGYVARRLGEEPSSSMGYSLAVGFNEKSGGLWNQEDSDLLYWYNAHPGSTAQWVQEQMMEVAKDRITSGTIHYPRFFKEKLRTFLGNDMACVGYSMKAISHTRRYMLACNGFYYGLLMLSIWGGGNLFRKRERSPILLAPLFVLGLTLAHMLVEVAGRYHYSILPMMILIAQYALFPPREQISEEKRKDEC